MDSCIVRVSRVSMGTVFEAVLAGAEPAFLEAAGNEALDEVERLEARLSHYREDSDLSDLNQHAAHGPVRMDPLLFDLLARAVGLAEATDGAFDPTAGPLVRCWGFFRGQGRLAAPEEVEAARQVVGWRLLELDAEAQTVRFRREGVQVHLGAIGKGYAVDCAVDILRHLRVPAALVHGGTSTLYALGAPPGAEAWRVGLRDPRNVGRRLGVIHLRDRALSTSGDYEQFFEVEGRRYSHLLDPRTGYPARGTASATLLADSATDTDALSTAAFVLGPGGARQICETFPGVGALLVPESGPSDDPPCPEVVVLGHAAIRLGDDTDDSDPLFVSTEEQTER